MHNGFLLEHVVLNTIAIKRFATQVADQVQNEAAKEWLKSRLWTLIHNTEAFLTPNHDALPDNAPEWARVAVNKGQTLYTFQPTPELVDRVQHVCDFFATLETLVGSTPTNAVEQERKGLATKILSKLKNITFDQLEQMHANWSKTGMKQAATLTKEGCEVVHQFEDGMYWVRYTNAATMKRDGADLQNCLAQGNYWSQVQAGTQAVFGLRKPNDEAVVGVRVLLKPEQYSYAYGNSKKEYPQVVECKGKQNGPARPEYRPYIRELLKRLQVFNDSPDLQKAGIFFNDGNYGTFEDIAHVIYDQDGVKILQALSKLGGNTMIMAGRFHFWADVRPHGDDGYKLVGISDYKAVPRQAVISGLNALGLSPEGDAAKELRDVGVVGSDKGFGTIEEVGDTVWISKDGKNKCVTAFKDKTGYIFFIHGEKTGNLFVNDGVIQRIPNGDLSFRHIVDGINAARVRFSKDIEVDKILSAGYVPTDDGYKSIYSQGMSTAVYNKDGAELRKVTSKSKIKVYLLMDSNKDGIARFIIGRSVMKQFGDSNGGANSWRIRYAVQTLLELEKIQKIEGAHDQNRGVYTDPDGQRLRSSLARFLEIAKANSSNKIEGVMMDPYDLSQVIKHGFMKHRDEGGELSARAQTAIMRAFKPLVDDLIELQPGEDLPLGDVKVVHATKSVFPTVLAALPLYKHLAQEYTAKSEAVFKKKMKPGTIYMMSGNERGNLKWDAERHNRAMRNELFKQMNELPEGTPTENVFKTLNVLRKAP